MQVKEAHIQVKEAYIQVKEAYIDNGALRNVSLAANPSPIPNTNTNANIANTNNNANTNVFLTRILTVILLTCHLRQTQPQSLSHPKP